ncbi:MAG: hypothetical protein ACLFVJ_03420 [Persicimonas sp.]
MFVITAAYATSMIACGDVDSPQVTVDAEQPDAGAEPDTGGRLESSLPQGWSEIFDGARLTHMGPRIDLDDPDAWTPPEHIATCSELLDCHSRCRADPDCIDACDDAATAEARSQEQALVSCINSAGCSNQQCIMENCGHKMNACFGQ